MPNLVPKGSKNSIFKLELAKIYARAIYSHSRNQRVDDWLKFLNILEEIWRFPEFRDLSWDRMYTNSMIIDILLSVFKASEFPLKEDQCAFLPLVVGEKIFPILPLIRMQLNELANRDAGLLDAQVWSVFELTQEQKRAIVESLLQRTGSKEISIKYLLDPTLLGGILIRYGNTLIDFSIKNGLEQLCSAIGRSNF